MSSTTRSKGFSSDPAGLTEGPGSILASVISMGGAGESSRWWIGGPTWDEATGSPRNQIVHIQIPTDDFNIEWLLLYHEAGRLLHRSTKATTSFGR